MVSAYQSLPMSKLIASLLMVATCLGGSARADKIDDHIKNLIATRPIWAVSVAVIEGGKIVKAQGYGFTGEDKKTPVTPSTLFQAASISKAVAAMAALRLVDQGRLALDEDVNTRLKSWKVPENEFTATAKVTLAGLLSHTAGIGVSGFQGYQEGAAVPSLLQVLDGAAPANSPAVRVMRVPGTKGAYSGGGYTIMQQMLIDVSGKGFEPFMRETVLDVLGMSSSAFEQPLPQNKWGLAAHGYSGYPVPTAVAGRWKTYPELAAAGVWTTPSDLARFVMGLQRSLQGLPGTNILSQDLARKAVSPYPGATGFGHTGAWGLGFQVGGQGVTRRFEHGGDNPGFTSLFRGYAETGQGAAVMINENDSAVFQILETVAQQYSWPGSPGFVPPPTIALVSPAEGGTVGGTPVTITGTNLSNTVEVTFGGLPASFTVSSNTEVSCVTPAHAAGTVAIVLTTKTAPVVSADAFRYAPAPPVDAGVADGTSIGGCRMGGGPLNESPALLIIALTAVLLLRRYRPA